MNKLLFLLSLLGVTVFISVAVTAQNATEVEFAGVRDKTLVIYRADGSFISVPNPPYRELTNLVWSLDGTRLAYVLMDLKYQQYLMVTDADGSEPITLVYASDLLSYFPVSWTPDGNLLFAQAPEYDSEARFAAIFAVIAPEVAARPYSVGQVKFQDGCYRIAVAPTTYQQYVEIGDLVGGVSHTLESTDFGVLYTLNCAGFGYGLLDPVTGESHYRTPTTFPYTVAFLHDEISSATLSPDETTLAVIHTLYRDRNRVRVERAIRLIDLATGAKIADIPTRLSPERIAWSASGDLYYAAETQSNRDLLRNLTPAQRDRLNAFGIGENPIPSFSVTISRVNIDSGEEITIFTDEASHIGRMVEAPDGSLWFSLIPNFQVWLEAVADGKVELGGLPSQHLDMAQVTVWRLPNGATSGDAAELVNTNLTQFALRPQ